MLRPNDGLRGTRLRRAPCFGVMFTKAMSWDRGKSKKALLAVGIWMVLANIIGLFRLVELQKYGDHLPNYFIARSVGIYLIAMVCGVLIARQSIHGFYGYCLLFLYQIGYSVIAETTILNIWRLLFTLVMVFFLYSQFVYIEPRKHNKIKNENASKAGTDAATERRPF